MTQLALRFAPLLFLVMLSAACVSTQVSAEFGTDDLSPGRPIRPVLNNRDIDDLIKARDYDSVFFRVGSLSSTRQDGRFSADYNQLAEKIKRAGDREYKQGNFVLAGSIYNRLLESGISAGSPADALSFTREYLKRQIKACSKMLTDLGLIKYREQQLSEAVAIWRQILLFDPGNRTISKAIATASRQSSSLRLIQ